MKFAYIVFLSLYCVIGIIGIAVTTIIMCKAKDNKTVAFTVIQWLLIAGFLAQFIADGIRVIGG